MLHAILNDIHIGVRQDSMVFAEMQARFYNEVFFPYIRSHAIKSIWMLGDIFDKRKLINFKSLDYAMENIFSRFLPDEIVEVTIGNHDIALRNSNRINSPKLLLSQLPNFIIHESFIETERYCLVPWLNEENEDMIQCLFTTKAPYCFGHFEIAGIEAERGMVMNHGMLQETFARFDFVGSGHYHHKTTTGNIHYFGTQYQLTWNDLGSRKGFHVFDDETGKLTFIENPDQMFFEVLYNDSMTPKDAEKYTGKMVKLYVPRERDSKKKEKFIDAMDCHELIVIDEALIIVETIDGVAQEETPEFSTLDWINKTINESDEITDEKKSKLVLLLSDLHKAVTSDSVKELVE